MPTTTNSDYIDYTKYSISGYQSQRTEQCPVCRRLVTILITNKTLGICCCSSCLESLSKVEPTRIEKILKRYFKQLRCLVLADKL